MTATPGASDGAALSRTTPPTTSLDVSKHNHHPPTNVDELREEIAQTREELGETVQALAARADVKARLQDTKEEAKARVRAQLHSAAAEAKVAAAEAPERAQVLAVRTRDAVRRNPTQFAAVAGAVVLVVLFIRWRRGWRA